MRGDVRGVRKVDGFPPPQAGNYLLIVYATWCGACHAFGKQLNTHTVQYRHTGEKKALGHTLAAEIDVLAVEYVETVQQKLEEQKVRLEFYPTVYAVRGTDGAILEQFENPRTPERLIAFARKHKSNAAAAAKSAKRKAETQTHYRLVAIDARTNEARPMAEGTCSAVQGALASEVSRVAAFVEKLRNSDEGDVRVSVRFRARNQARVWETVTHSAAETKHEREALNKEQEKNARELAEVFRHCHRNNFEVRIERARPGACCEPPDATWGRVNGHCCAYTKTYKMQTRS